MPCCMRGALVFWRRPKRRATMAAMTSDNLFYGVVGLLSLAGGGAILLWETPFSQVAGWFGVVTGAGLLLVLAYNLVRGRR